MLSETAVAMNSSSFHNTSIFSFIASTQFPLVWLSYLALQSVIPVVALSAARRQMVSKVSFQAFSFSSEIISCFPRSVSRQGWIALSRSRGTTFSDIGKRWYSRNAVITRYDGCAGGGKLCKVQFLEGWLETGKWELLKKVNLSLPPVSFIHKTVFHPISQSLSFFK